MGSNSRTQPSFPRLLGDTGLYGAQQEGWGPHKAQMLTPLPPMGKAQHPTPSPETGQSKHQCCGRGCGELEPLGAGLGTPLRLLGCFSGCETGRPEEP